jgi:hypothetical protein
MQLFLKNRIKSSNTFYNPKPSANAEFPRPFRNPPERVMARIVMGNDLPCNTRKIEI